MLTEDNVLKAIVKHRNADGHTLYSDITSELSIDDISLITLLKTLEKQGYITQTMEDVTVTSLGMSAYNNIRTRNKFKRSIFKFSKFTFQRLLDIFIGIVIGVIIAYIVYHFGWQ